MINLLQAIKKIQVFNFHSINFLYIPDFTNIEILSQSGQGDSKVHSVVASENLDNQALIEVQQELNAKYRNRVRVTRNTMNEDFIPDELAIDCFHPNVTAQNRLAEISWQSTWWGNNRF